MWSEERTELCVKLWDEGLSASQVASRIGGISRNAVIGKMHRMGLSSQAPHKTRLYPKPKRVKRRSEGFRRARPHELRLASEGIAPASPRIAAEPLPPEPPRPDKLVAFADLTDKTCRFIYGDPKSNDWGFCCHEKAPGSSYCAGHMGKCTAQQPPRKRRPPEDIIRNKITGRAVDTSTEYKLGILRRRQVEVL